MTSGEGILSSTGFPTPLLITPSGKAAPRRPDPGIRRRIQIGTLRPIRVDHTKCLQVAIKTHSLTVEMSPGLLVSGRRFSPNPWALRSQ